MLLTFLSLLTTAQDLPHALQAHLYAGFKPNVTGTSELLFWHSPLLPSAASLLFAHLILLIFP